MYSSLSLPRNRLSVFLHLWVFYIFSCILPTLYEPSNSLNTVYCNLIPSTIMILFTSWPVCMSPMCWKSSKTADLTFSRESWSLSVCLNVWYSWLLFLPKEISAFNCHRGTAPLYEPPVRSKSNNICIGLLLWVAASLIMSDCAVRISFFIVFFYIKENQFSFWDTFLFDGLLKNTFRTLAC